MRTRKKQNLDLSEYVTKICEVGDDVLFDGKLGAMRFVRKPKPEPKLAQKEFEVGKYYKHAGGGFLHILGVVKPTMWNVCFVAEEAGHGCNQLKPVGMDKDASVNWSECPKEEWENLFQ